MDNNNLLKDLQIGFSKLNEENKQYVLAIAQSLIFAQNMQKNSQVIEQENGNTKGSGNVK